MVVAELAAKLGLVPDEKAWAHGHELVETLHHALEAYLGVEAIKKTGELVEGFVETAVAAKHLGERVGLSTDAVQELGYAASLSGSSAEAMQVSLQHLARGLNELQTKGTGPAATGLQQLGVSAASIKDKAPDEVLGVLAEKFAKLPDGAKKTAIAMELFGRSGTELIPLLNRGSEGIAELREEAEKLGVVIGDEGVEKAEEFERAQKRLGATLKGLKNTAVEALLPALQEMVEGLSAWVSENREAIVSTLETVVRGLAEAFHLVGAAISAVIEFFKEHQQLFITGLEALGILLAAFAIEAFADWVIAFAPLIGVVALIGLIIYAIRKLVLAITGGKDDAVESWGDILEGGESVQDFLEDLPNKVSEWFSDMGDSIKQAFEDAWDYVVKTAKDAWHEIEDIPVIGHLIRATEAIGGGVGNIAGQLAGGDTGTLQEKLQLAQLGVTSGGQTISFESNHSVTVNAADIDEDTIGDIVAEHIDGKNKELIRSAIANISGGRR